MTYPQPCDVLCFGATFPCFAISDMSLHTSNLTLRDLNKMMAKKSPNPTDKYVGSRVRMRRLMLGMSQEKLGEKLGLTFQQVQKYEKGTNRIGASRLQHISQILKVPVAFFFEGPSQNRPKTDRQKRRSPTTSPISCRAPMVSR